MVAAQAEYEKVCKERDQYLAAAYDLAYKDAMSQPAYSYDELVASSQAQHSDTSGELGR